MPWFTSTATLKIIDSVAIVFHQDALDAVQVIAIENDLDDLGVRIERVPDQLLDSPYRPTLREADDEVRRGLDRELLGSFGHATPARSHGI